MNIIPYIIAVLSLMSGVYFYVENRKLRGFKIDKDIKLKEVEFEELNNQYKEEGEELEKKMARRGIGSSGIARASLARLRDKYNLKFEKIWAEQRYLESLKKYRWIFGKPKRRPRRKTKK